MAFKQNNNPFNKMLDRFVNAPGVPSIPSGASAGQGYLDQLTALGKRDKEYIADMPVFDISSSNGEVDWEKVDTGRRQRSAHTAEYGMTEKESRKFQREQDRATNRLKREQKRDARRLKRQERRRKKH